MCVMLMLNLQHHLYVMPALNAQHSYCAVHMLDAQSLPVCLMPMILRLLCSMFMRARAKAIRNSCLMACVHWLSATLLDFVCGCIIILMMCACLTVGFVL